jgi:hypothetical protein
MIGKYGLNIYIIEFNIKDGIFLNQDYSFIQNYNKEYQNIILMYNNRQFTYINSSNYKKIISNLYNQLNIKQILVYCHPRDVVDTPPHFLLDGFIELLHKYNITNHKFHTVDTSGTPDYKEDGFSPDFLDKFSNDPYFDIVILPDCGGLWYELQKDKIDVAGFINLINNILKIVKIDGKLIISKILYDSLWDKLNEHYENSNFIYFSNHPDMKLLEITK